MGNLRGMEDALEFPDHEAMVDWLRRQEKEKEAEATIQLPLPEPDLRPIPVETPRRREPIVFDIA